MKRQYKSAAVVVAIALFLGAGNAMAQQEADKLKQEVEVSKAYQPTINEAVKINDIPKVKAEPVEPPTFDYSIYSKPIFSTFEVKPVAAAKMVGEPRPEMGLGLLKLGFGNYLTPYGELFFNAQPDKKSNFGMHFKHLSSYGKIKLLNDDLVKAPESENEAEIFGKKFFRKSTLSGNLGFDRKAFTYYGYTGDMLTDEQKEQMIPYYQDKQYFAKGTAKVRLKTETLSEYDLNYDFGLRFHMFKSKTGQTENQFVASGDVGKKYGNTFGILNASLTYVVTDSIWNRITDGYGKKTQTLLRANPSVKWAVDGASIQLGLNSTIAFDEDADAAIYIWPKLKGEWSPVKQVLTLFVGVDGHLQHNSYSAIAAENPFVDPYHDLKNTRHQYILSGGLKGKLSSKTNYVAQTSYSKVKDQYFYILYGRDILNTSATGPRSLNNTFDWVYDDLNILKLSGEVLHSVSDNFSLHLMGNYYSYDLNSLEKAWQMPDYDFTFSGIYKPTEQLKFTTDIFVVGSRPALVSEMPVSSLPSLELKMNSFIDLNVGGEYQFTDQLNFFAKLNNFGFQKYEQWLGYTNKGLNWMAGISYSF